MGRRRIGDGRPNANPLAGKWRIVETGRWDSACLDRVEPALVGFGAIHGEMPFGCLEAALECSWSQTDVGFTFHGRDEGTEVGGDGRVELDGPDAVMGETAFRHGDEPVLKARRWR